MHSFSRLVGQRVSHRTEYYRRTAVNEQEEENIFLRVTSWLIRLSVNAHEQLFSATGEVPQFAICSPAIGCGIFSALSLLHS